MENIIKLTPSAPGRGRKLVSARSKWKKEKEKRARHIAQEMPQYPQCNHNGMTYRCSRLKMQDIKEFHAKFYSSANKVQQDAFILKYCKGCKPKRNRSLKPDSSKKGVSVQYFVKLADCKQFELQVCQKAFLNILKISKDRVQRIVRNHTTSGEMPQENRGGDRRRTYYEEKRTSVKTFIESLQGVETHYCRGKSMSRQYLSSDLNISKIFRTYNNNIVSPQLKVKTTFFRKIFTEEYNVGFGSPVTDACSRCIQLAEQIKIEKDVRKKTELMIERRVHKLRGKAFFLKLSEEKENMVTFSFDCQKNLVNPKIPDQVAYYSRQLYTYNFTICKGSSHSKITADNVFIYTWMEHERPKGSNEISSAVFDCLSKSDLTNYSVVRLCADGCGGQNRNSTMICMCSFWLATVAPPSVKRVEIVFPVTGHSFLPSDRVFGRIEKILKNKATITDPEEYIEVFKNHGTVLKLGRDCPVNDWKQQAGDFLKPTGSWHFKFSSMKRFILVKTRFGNVHVQGEASYMSDIGEAKPILKKGKRLNCIARMSLPIGVPVNPAKLKDVRRLLEKHFGDNWPNMEGLNFYKNLLRTEGDQWVENQDDDFCSGECNENDEQDLRI